MIKLVFPILLFFCLNLMAQTSYKVVSIEGKIVNLSKKDTLLEGSTYDFEAKLSIENEEDYMGVVDEFNNTFLVCLLPGTDSITYEAIPSALNSRDGEIINDIAMILHFAEKTNYLILGDEIRIKVGPDKYPISADSFFYVRYIYGNEQIDKKLAFEGNTVILSKDELFQAKFQKSEILGPGAIGDTILTINPSLATDFEFRYYTTHDGPKHIPFLDLTQADDQQIRGFIPFQPVFLNHSDLVKEIDKLYKKVKKARRDLDQKSHILSVATYIQEKFQGKVYLPNLESWMKEYRIIE